MPCDCAQGRASPGTGMGEVHHVFPVSFGRRNESDQICRCLFFLGKKPRASSSRPLEQPDFLGKRGILFGADPKPVVRGWLLFQSHHREAEHVELWQGAGVLENWTFLGAETHVTVLCFAPCSLFCPCALPKTLWSLANLFETWH